ncbi:MAG TPA: ribosome maturation factor RimP [Candidatus Hydrogenedentes bacterium]|nr:ribosome maturation factor RimP [Candidatus Hydrogenedentota bacterium]
MQARNEIIRRSWQELEPDLAEQGYELVEVEYEQQGGHGLLRLYIDCEAGVTLDDCAAVSQLLSPLLDMKDYIKSAYTLEVSSPGIDRPVRKPLDFARFTGERVKLHTYEPVQGRKRFKGILQGLYDGLVRVECDGPVYDIHLENLKKVKLDR